VIIDINMPNLEGVTEATIVKWWKKVGDSIKEKEVLLEVMTEKVNTEIESPVSGIVFEIIYPNDSVVKVGAVIAKIEQKD
jgi:2-oxoglutarate dehydrogenase E2 component (dihydrolipoamide succinyltransferase)